MNETYYMAAPVNVAKVSIRPGAERVVRYIQWDNGVVTRARRRASEALHDALDFCGAFSGILFLVYSIRVRDDDWEHMEINGRLDVLAFEYQLWAPANEEDIL